MTGKQGALLASLAAAWIAGCATPPPTPTAETPRVAVQPAPRASLAETGETTYRERAKHHAQEGHWAEALVYWELLTLLKPDSAEYRAEFDRVRNHIRQTAAALLHAASSARRRGELDHSVELYIKVLSMEPDNAAAAEALRQIERQRIRRAYLNRPPRLTLQ